VTKYEKNKDADLTDPLPKKGIKGDIWWVVIFLPDPFLPKPQLLTAKDVKDGEEKQKRICQGGARP